MYLVYFLTVKYLGLGDFSDTEFSETNFPTPNFLKQNSVSENLLPEKFPDTNLSSSRQRISAVTPFMHLRHLCYNSTFPAAAFKNVTEPDMNLFQLSLDL